MWHLLLDFPSTSTKNDVDVLCKREVVDTDGVTVGFVFPGRHLDEGVSYVQGLLPAQGGGDSFSSGDQSPAGQTVGQVFAVHLNTHSPVDSQWS